MTTRDEAVSEVSTSQCVVYNHNYCLFVWGFQIIQSQSYLFWYPVQIFPRIYKNSGPSLIYNAKYLRTLCLVILRAHTHTHTFGIIKKMYTITNMVTPTHIIWCIFSKLHLQQYFSFVLADTACMYAPVDGASETESFIKPYKKSSSLCTDI